MILRRAPGGGPAPYSFRASARGGATAPTVVSRRRCAAIRRARRTGRPGIPARLQDIGRHRGATKYAHRRPASGAPTASRRHRWCSARRWWSNRPPHARGHRCVRADAAVVTHHDLVVQLDAVGHEGVFERAAIDRGVGADLDVVADGHAAQLGILPQAPCPSEGSGAKPKPSAPSTTPLWRMARAPTLTPSYRVTCACSRLSGPTEEPTPITQPGPSTAPRPMRAPDSTTQSGPMRAPSSMTASAATTAEGCVPPGSAGRRAASNHWATRAYSR